MRITVLSGAEQDSAQVERALTAAGHELLAWRGDEGPAQAPRGVELVLAVLKELPAGSAAERLRRSLQTARDSGVPTLAVTLGPPTDRPPDVADLAVDEWLPAKDAAEVADAVRARIPAQPGPRPVAAAVARRRADALRQTATKVRGKLQEVSVSEPVSQAAQRLLATARRGEGSEPQEGAVPPKCSVFVSYSSKDSRAKDVVAELERLGFRVWVDTSAIKGAEDYRISIERGIRAADAFVLLLSPNVSRDPAWVRLELNAAQSSGRKIVPVRLHRTERLPEGFELVLEGLHRVDLFPDFAKGMERLAEALGAQEVVAPSGALAARVRRRAGQLRHLAEDHDLAGKAKVAGGAAVATAGMALAVAAKVLAEQDRQHRAEDEAQQQQALADYVSRTLRLLTDGMEEVQLSTGPSAEDYRNDFRPAYLMILGELKGNRPPRADLQPRHDQLVEELRKLLDELDHASRKADKGDLRGYQRAIQRCDRQWSKLVVSSVEWLQSIP